MGLQRGCLRTVWQGLCPTHYCQSVSSGAPRRAVAKVIQSDWDGLIHVLEYHARNKSFIDNIDQYGAPEWEVSDLLSSIALPAFGWHPYPIFLAHPPVSSNGVVDGADPRHKAQSIPYDPKYKPSEPLIAIYVSGRHMLIEGYLRSILWLRNPSTPLPVFIPALGGGGTLTAWSSGTIRA